MQSNESETARPIGIIAGGGVLPFALAEALAARGRTSFFFAIKGSCDPERLKRFPHHWVALGQVGRLTRLLRSERCRDVTFIGSLVRPALSEIRFDFETFRVAPRIYAAFRGGDDHLLTGIGRLFEDRGFRLVGIDDLAPELMMPEGCLTKAAPDIDATADIEKGLRLLEALGPFDVGQAAVVVDGNVVSMEDIAGTDALLARIVDLRASRRLRSKPGRGVLVKAPKAGQDLRFDLPTLGPRTVDGVAVAQLAGIAIVAGRTLLAESQRVVTAANAAGVFVTGLRA
jgi:DUF1009 family protein